MPIDTNVHDLWKTVVSQSEALAEMGRRAFADDATDESRAAAHEAMKHAFAQMRWCFQEMDMADPFKGDERASRLYRISMEEFGAALDRTKDAEDQARRNGGIIFHNAKPLDVFDSIEYKQRVEELRDLLRSELGGDDSEFAGLDAAISERLKHYWYVSGSGAEMLLGAIAAGASPQEAIEIVATFRTDEGRKAYIEQERQRSSDGARCS